jgi:hypothetical protein
LRATGFGRTEPHTIVEFHGVSSTALVVKLVAGPPARGALD